jgi:DNA polymerase sigma
MVLAYLKYPRVQSKAVLGRMLFEFFEYYGKSIKYNTTIIDCNSYT